MTAAQRVAVAALVAAAACSKAPVRSCHDSLSGVWRAGEAHRYHIIETPNGIEMYALFDTARPPSGDKASSPIVYAPEVFDFRRRPAGVVGTRTQRMDLAGTICSAKTRATISACRSDELTLTVQRPGPMEFASCTAKPGADHQLVLRR